MLGRNNHLYLSSTVVALALTCAARAEVVSGNSYGFGLQLEAGSGTGADLSLLGLGTTGQINATVNSSRFPSGASGAAPGAYDTGVLSTVRVFADGDLANVAGLTLGPLADISTSAGATLAAVSGTFNGRADSTVDGGLGSRIAHGFGSVENLNLDLVNLSLDLTTPLANGSLNPPPLLSFSQARNSTLSSDSTASGDFGGFTRTGTSIIANLGISLNGASSISLSSLLDNAGISYSQDVAGNISVAPNTVLSLGITANGTWPGLGAGLFDGVSLDQDTLLKLTLNKQVPTGDLLSSAGITTTALEIELLGFGLDLGLGGLATLETSGALTIDLGESQAELAGRLATVPEAGTWMAGVSCGLLALAGWRKGRSARRD